MIPATPPQPRRAPRRDGWTAERRRLFLDGLAAGHDVRRACAFVGLSREGAYRLRAREPSFARAWDEAQCMSRAAEQQRFFALLPERLRKTMSELSRQCELRGPESPARTVSEVSGPCELQRVENRSRTVSDL